MNNFLFLGYGYVAKHLAKILPSDDYNLFGTSRSMFHDENVECMIFDEILKISPEITHILISLPPKEEGDLSFLKFSEHIKRLKNLKWLGYLSTTGVYGDSKGEWVDENSKINPMNPSSVNRVTAENQWKSLDIPEVNIYRLAGIYGAGRSVVDDIMSGTLKQLVNKENQVFSRMHVEDIARALYASIGNEDKEQVYNFADDLPASSLDVAKHVLDSLGMEYPPIVEFQNANLSEMAKRFYSECRRVSNKKIKSSLNFKFLFPTYKEGMSSIIQRYQK